MTDVPSTDQIRRALAGPRAHTGPKNHLAEVRDGDAICLCGGLMEHEGGRQRYDKQRTRLYSIHRFRCTSCGKLGTWIEAK